MISVRKLAFAAGAFAVLLFGATMGCCKTVYVKTSGSNTADGLSWEAAKKSISAGITAAAAGDEVWVASGTYVLTGQLNLKDAVEVYGGFPQGGGDWSTRDINANTTLIQLSSVYSVNALTGVTPSALLDGFTIRRIDGGYCALYCSGSATFSHNRITCCKNGSSVAVSVTGSPVISNNLIGGNSAGAISCSGGSPVIVNNTITGNPGVAIRSSNSAATIANNIVAYNWAGISVTGPSKPALRNNCLLNDTYDYGGIGPGVGDMTTDPKLSGHDYGLFHLGSTSPCVNAGWSEAPGLPSLDMDAQPRMFGGTVDVGADEFDGMDLPPFSSPIVHVSPSGDNGHSGATWTDAKRTVQAGIDEAAMTGGEVWVAAGMYSECIELKQYVYLYGGFDGSETMRTQRDWKKNVTTIDAGGLGIVVLTHAPGYLLGCVDGFTLCNGRGSAGGAYCSASSPLISNNLITGNSGVGGSMAVGGVMCNNSYALVTNNIISQNTPGGIVCYGGAPTIANNFITENTGCGVTVDSSGPTIVNNTVANNSSGGRGAGMYLFSGSATVANNIIAQNSSGIYSTGSAKFVLTNNCVYNPDTYDYLGLSAGAGDIRVDPQLVAAGYGLVHIQPNSPCVDAGDDSVVKLGAIDIDGQARQQDGDGDGTARVDIGADESDGTRWSFTPRIVHVSTHGNDSNTGLSWSAAKATVQAGIDEAAEAGGEVWVAAGTYNERITLKRHAYLLGGFSGEEITRDKRDWSRHVAVLDGGGLGSVVSSFSPGYRQSCIDGFVVRNGIAGNGSGINLDHSSPAILNNVLTGNLAAAGSTNASVLWCYVCSPFVRGNTITRNSGAVGAIGIGLSSASPVVSENTISDNTGTGIFGIISSWCRIVGNRITGNGGAGFSTTSATGAPLISQNYVAGNSGNGISIWDNAESAIISANTISDNGGSGIHCQSCHPVLTCNVIGGNRSYGVWCTDSSSPITNNTIVANGAGGIYSNPNGYTQQVSNNIIAFNASGISNANGYSSLILSNNDVYNPTGANYTGLSAGATDISVNPLFADQAKADYHLTPLSPCINTGRNGASGLPLTDIDGEPRTVGGTVDMGADEAICVARIWGAKQVPNTTQLEISGATVTASFPNCFYIESNDRSSGIRVEKPGHDIPAGVRADVAGTASVNSDGERCILASSATASGVGFLRPFAMNNAMIGGGKYGFQDAAWGWRLLQDSSGELVRAWGTLNGLNSIGLLITTWGKVTRVDSSTFTVDDGSGNYVRCEMPGALTVDPSWNYVIVTGVCSCRKSGDRLLPCILVRESSDVQPR